MKEKHILPTVTEISANLVRPNSLAERNEERAVHPDIISLYETACGAEKKAIEANREETLRWCFYAREFKRMYKDFMVSNKVGEKKAKGQVYDFIIKQLPNTKRKTLCRQTQKALRIDDLFEKIGMDKLQYIKTYSADTISKFTVPQIQTIIDHFTEKPNMEFTDEAEDEEQDDEVPEGSDQNNVLEVLPLAKLTSTTPIPLSHDSNSSGDSSKISPVDSPKSQVSVPITTSSRQISESNQSRLPISILPEDSEEKRKHIIGLVLKKFPYLSLDDSDSRRDTFNLDSSALCPLCNGDHKVNRSIFDEIKGEWGAGEYYGEQTYRLKCRESFKPGIPIVSVKA